MCRYYQTPRAGEKFADPTRRKEISFSEVRIAYDRIMEGVGEVQGEKVRTESKVEENGHVWKMMPSLRQAPYRVSPRIGSADRHDTIDYRMFV